MFSDEYAAEDGSPDRVDERVDLMQRIVGLEQSERQQRERTKEARAKLEAIEGELSSARSALIKALEHTGVLPVTAASDAVSRTSGGAA